MKQIVHSVKHIVQFPIDQILTGIRESIILIHSVESTVANLSTEVAEGTLVKAVFVELWLQNQANLSESIVTVTKDNNNSFGPTFAEMGNLFAYTNKKNVLFTHQGLSSNDAIGNPVRVLYGWIKIPKGKQRFGLGDTLTLSVSNVSANDLNRCGMSIYKEYS